MEFFKRIISPRKKLVSFGHVKNLLQMANVDGEYHPLESDFLKTVKKDSRISKQKLDEIRSIYNEINFRLPEEKIERFYQLYNVIKMMIADNKVFDEERAFCTHLAKTLDFKKDVIDRLIDSIESNIREGHDIEETALRISALLKFNQ